MFFSKQFGGKIDKAMIAQYSQSPNWKDGCFHNYEPATLGISLKKIPGAIYKQLSNQSVRQPQKPLPVSPLAVDEFIKDSPDAHLVWYGHSAMLLNVQGTYILIDPMLGPNTSPIAPFATKRFSENSLSLIDDFPHSIIAKSKGPNRLPISLKWLP